VFLSAKGPPPDAVEDTRKRIEEHPPLRADPGGLVRRRGACSGLSPAKGLPARRLTSR